jgi:tetratricopeptide (TPR) repeat protein
MKRAAMVVMMLGLTTFVFAQQPASYPQNPPASQTGTPKTGAAQQSPGQPGAPQPATTPATPQGKRPPQAKTDAEFAAFNAAIANTNDPAAVEKAADDFATKYPDSELRVLLYGAAMQSYQRANNADKMMEMGRKVLKIDPDEPTALVGVAQVLAERTRDTDLDKEQRLDEAMKLAQRSLTTVDTDIAPSPNTPQEKIDAFKGVLRSSAYAIMGTLEFNKEKYADAENYYRKSIDAYPAQLDPVVVLRLALALDKQGKYPEALKEANHAVELTQEGSTAGGLARRERDRLVQLTGGSPTPASKPPASAQNPAPPKN